MRERRRLLRVRRDVTEQARSDVADEIAFHLDMVVEELMASGMDEQSARARAARQFGDIAAAQSALEAETRRTDEHTRRTELLAEMRQDVRYALRVLIRSPVFAIAAILTLALGIGANAGVFAVAFGVLWEQLPYRASDRLLLAWEDNTAEQQPRYDFSPANYRDMRERARTLAGLAAFDTYVNPNITGPGEPERATTVRVMGDFFGVLGVDAARGRVIQPTDEIDGATPVVVLLHGLWQRRFGGDPAIVGRTIELNGQSIEIVGVMPPEFEVPGAPDVELITPLRMTPDDWALRNVHFLTLVGRLRDDATVTQAQAELNGIAADLERAYPESNRGTRVTALSLREALVGDVRTMLFIVLGAVGLVLLAACANVANLLLARAAGRERELGVRAALGAGRGRIVRQLLTESGVLALLGTAAGVALAAVLVRGVRTLGPAILPRLGAVTLNGYVVVFALGCSLLTALLVGALPALCSMGMRLSALHTGTRGSSSRAQQRVRRAIVTGQIALSLVLLTGATLLGRSFQSLLAIDPGFAPDSVLTFTTLKRGEAVPVIRFYDDLLAHVRALPGVVHAGAINRLPLAEKGPTSWLRIENHVWQTPTPPEVGYRPVTPGYFEAMGIPLLRGRRFEPADRGNRALPVLINAIAAERFFAGRDPVGVRIRLGPNPQAQWRTIIGVVGDTRNIALTEAVQPEVYPLQAQSANGTMMIAVRTRRAPVDVLPAVRAHVTSLDPQVPIEDVRTMRDLVAQSVARPRFTLLLLAVFAGLGLVLAVVGTYGVLAHLVAQRTKEIGIRVALGARRGDVLRLVITEGAVLAAAGIVMGTALALLATRVLRNLLYGVSPTDPLTFGAAALVLALLTMLACWIPARAALRLDPNEALRTE
jgi:predicted permease